MGVEWQGTCRDGHVTAPAVKGVALHDLRPARSRRVAPTRWMVSGTRPRPESTTRPDLSVTGHDPSTTRVAATQSIPIGVCSVDILVGGSFRLLRAPKVRAAPTESGLATAAPPRASIHLCSDGSGSRTDGHYSCGGGRDSPKAVPRTSATTSRRPRARVRRPPSTCVSCAGAIGIQCSEHSSVVVQRRRRALAGQARAGLPGPRASDAYMEQLAEQHGRARGAGRIDMPSMPSEEAVPTSSTTGHAERPRRSGSPDGSVTEVPICGRHAPRPRPAHGPITCSSTVPQSSPSGTASRHLGGCRSMPWRLSIEATRG